MIRPGGQFYKFQPGGPDSLNLRWPWKKPLAFPCRRTSRVNKRLIPAKRVALVESLACARKHTAEQTLGRVGDDQSQTLRKGPEEHILAEASADLKYSQRRQDGQTGYARRAQRSNKHSLHGKVSSKLSAQFRLAARLKPTAVRDDSPTLWSDHHHPTRYRLSGW